METPCFGFFNSCIADKLQIISLPLELVGLCLAIIEIYFPKIRSLIEETIKTISKLKNYKVVYKYLRRRHWIKEHGGTVTIPGGCVAALGFIIALLPAFALFGDVIDAKWMMNLDGLLRMILQILFFLITIVIWIVLGYIVWFLISYPIFIVFYFPFWILFIVFGRIAQQLDKITNGKSIGAMGLVLASLGVLGEIYQVCEMFFGS